MLRNNLVRPLDVHKVVEVDHGVGGGGLRPLPLCWLLLLSCCYGGRQGLRHHPRLRRCPQQRVLLPEDQRQAVAGKGTARGGPGS